MKNQACAKIGPLPSPDARLPGAQRLPVSLRDDLCADPGHSSAAADPKLADQVLDRWNPIFCELNVSEGRLSVPPDQLLLASLLQAFYGIRSELLLLEQLHYNILHR
jgi:hypothetical protein